MQCNCKGNSLFTSLPFHQVSISTHMHSVHFSAFSVHYAQCTSRPWRHTNTGYNAVTRDSGAGRLLPHTNRHSLPTKYVEKVGKLKFCGSIHTLRPPPDQRGDVSKFGSYRFRNVDLCKFHTNKHSSLYIRLAGAPGVARDYQSRNLMYGVIFWYKEKERHNSDRESMSRSGCWRECRSVRRNVSQ